MPRISDFAVFRYVKQVAAFGVRVTGDLQSDKWSELPDTVCILNRVFRSPRSQMMGAQRNSLYGSEFRHSSSANQDN